MDKENYLKIIETDPDVINLEKQDVIDWLNAIVDAMQEAKNNIYELSWGCLDFDKGEYEHNISPCMAGNDFNLLHIYSGIEKLASAVGIPLAINNDHSEQYPIEYYFEYKNVKIFQLEQTNILNI